jgi:hypothetical protein
MRPVHLLQTPRHPLQKTKSCNGNTPSRSSRNNLTLSNTEKYHLSCVLQKRRRNVVVKSWPDIAADWLEIARRPMPRHRIYNSTNAPLHGVKVQRRQYKVIHAKEYENENFICLRG